MCILETFVTLFALQSCKMNEVTDVRNTVALQFDRSGLRIKLLLVSIVTVISLGLPINLLTVGRSNQ